MRISHLISRGILRRLRVSSARLSSWRAIWLCRRKRSPNSSPTPRLIQARSTMASPGNGTAPHLCGELFKMMTGIDFVHVPYRGNYMPDLLGGQVQIVFSTATQIVEYISAGKLRALGVTSAQRLEALPDVPAIGESVPGYEALGWFGVGAPKNTPLEIIEKTQLRGQHCGRFSRHQRTPGRAGRIADVDDIGGVRKIHRRRNRKMGQGDPGGQHQAGMNEPIRRLPARRRRAAFRGCPYARGARSLRRRNTAAR